MNNNRTVTGMDENIEGAICYFLGFVTGILFLIIEKDNKFVRFHAAQSTAIFLPLFVLSIIINSGIFLWSIWIMISTTLVLVEFILWIFLMYEAYQGEMFKLPIVGDIAEQISREVLS